MNLDIMMKLILASGSPRRSELMKQAGLSFTVMEVAESAENELTASERDPEKFAALAAAGKLDAALAMNPPEPCVVICADTVVAVDGKIFGKPGDGEAAAEMLRTLGGRSHRVITACALAELPGRTREEFREVTQVDFFPLSESMIDAYIDTGEPFDKAGAYGIQDRAAAFVSGVRGCYPNVVGLPVGKLLRVLDEKFSVRVEDFWKRTGK